MRDLDSRTSEDEVVSYFRQIMLPSRNPVNVIKINSAYRMESYDAKLTEVTTLKNKIKLQQGKELIRLQ